MSDKTMRAIGYSASGPLSAETFTTIELPRPTAKGHDLLVEVHAVSVNPVDTKVRRRAGPAEGESHKILGWDAAGIVTAVGPEATGFKPGDRVWYAGDLTRSGTNAEYHLVDARIASKAPESLSFAEAAALPLTTLTAWEMLFDRLRVAQPVPGVDPALLIIGGAGGVGSITIQLARALTDLTVIATASRPETRDWVQALGAHHTLDHSKPLDEELTAQGLAAPGFVFSTTGTEGHLPAVTRLIAPQGRFGLIDDPDTLDIKPFKLKSISTHWEMMYTRSMFQTADIARQGEILAEVAGMIDAGTVKTTLTETLGKITPENLTRAHELLESGTARGKIVLEGF